MTHIDCNIAFLLKGAYNTEFITEPQSDLNSDEVLVQVVKTGICGSDIHFYTDGRLGENVVTEPIILGHESSGIVSQVGTSVKDVKLGDRVAIEPWATCRKCQLCKTGKYHMCAYCTVFTRPRRGTLARYYKIPSDFTHKLPNHLTFEDGAMMEPLAVAVHALTSVTDFRAGQNITVFGCGPVGLLCMAVARALGASRVIGIDINQPRLDFAKKYAATDVYLVPQPGPDSLVNGNMTNRSKSTVSKMMTVLGVEERGTTAMDFVIDATGAESCIQMAVLLVKYGGTFIQLGFGEEIKLPILTIMTKELKLRGSNRYGPGDYSLAISLVASGKVDVKPLITHRFSFEDARLAFDTTKAGKSADDRTVIKTIITGPGINSSVQ